MTKRGRRVRSGLIVPLVLVAMLLVLTMTGALQSMAWRGVRGARTQWEAQRAFYAADAAIATGLSAWTSEQMARLPIGVSTVSSVTDVAQWVTQLTVIRTGALSAIMRATVERTSIMRLTDPGRVKRTVVRYVRLDPPTIPVVAAVTILGDASIALVQFDGRDRLSMAQPDADDCGPVRDTASVPALAVAVGAVVSSSVLTGGRTEMSVPAVAEARARLENAWETIQKRSAQQSVTASGELIVNPLWRAIVIDGAPTVTLTGSSTHVGALVINGDLIVRGTLRVVGMLLVRGAVDATGGRLDVAGALVVGDRNSRGSLFDSGTMVRYAPCLALRALAAISRPQIAPFLTWNAP